MNYCGILHELDSRSTQRTVGYKINVKSAMKAFAVVILIFLGCIHCQSHNAVLSSRTDKERAWAVKKNSLFGIELSQKLFYCYADSEKKSQPICVEAEFVEKD